LKNPKVWAVVIATLVLLGVGFMFFRPPQPLIEIHAEPVGQIGPFEVVNTWVSSVAAITLIVILAFFATRKLSLVPNRLQNVLEGVVEALYNICVTTAGEKNARRFFPVIMTIFVYIWIANWMALLPFFNSIGKVEPVDPDHFHHFGIIFEDAGGWFSFIRPNTSEIDFHPEDFLDADEIAAVEAEIERANDEGFPAELIGELQEARTEAEREARAQAILHGLVDAGEVPPDTATYEEAIAHLDAEGKQVAVLFPYFRSMNTDLMSPLSIAIWALIFVEFWGITTLGFFSYASKFFTIKSPIAFFVGILEFIAEIARIISFTARLFGNMLAGEILLLVMTFLVPFIVAIPFYGLEVFIGLIQAFVFAMLTLVFGVLAVSSHEHHEEHVEIQQMEPGDGAEPEPVHA
jgi:F-type H+-transporting ATPase subunit a